ncbi:hypothetical protein ANRL3_03064 [Anaerolineae bacterium]|nr:hypothetical protein ANRL3_03064 [Anaerolineae bacterium]
MTNSLLLYAGSLIVIVWGIAHIAPTRSVIAGFGTLSADNRQIITMEWVAEGFALSFIGVLTLLITLQASGPNPVATLVYRVCASMLVIMAGWTFATGARTSIVPIKICPLVKTTAAVLLFLGSVV